jgi:hypothetical protein
MFICVLCTLYTRKSHGSICNSTHYSNYTSLIEAYGRLEPAAAAKVFDIMRSNGMEPSVSICVCVFVLSVRKTRARDFDAINALSFLYFLNS